MRPSVVQLERAMALLPRETAAYGGYRPGEGAARRPAPVRPSQEWVAVNW